MRKLLIANIKADLVIKMKTITKIVLAIFIVLAIIFAPEIKLYNTKIDNYNYQQIIEDVYTSKISDNKKAVIITKLIMNHDKYEGKKVKDLI